MKRRAGETGGEFPFEHLFAAPVPGGDPVLNGNSTAIAVNAATNQLANASYDSNGNMISGVGATLGYDVSNRLASAVETSGGIEGYGYAPDNKRIFRKTSTGIAEWTLYGVRGEKLGTYAIGAYSNPASPSTFAFQPVVPNVWFAGKLISGGQGASAVYQDRLGTNRASGNAGAGTTTNGARFYPYGEEITNTANDRVKFGTYTRDSYTGLDYADQRYYASTYGRFNTADQFAGSAVGRNPGTWNRYAYVGGDPINMNDPKAHAHRQHIHRIITGMSSSTALISRGIPMWDCQRRHTLRLILLRGRMNGTASARNARRSSRAITE